MEGVPQRSASILKFDDLWLEMWRYRRKYRHIYCLKWQKYLGYVSLLRQFESFCGVKYRDICTPNAEIEAKKRQKYRRTQNTHEVPLAPGDAATT